MILVNLIGNILDLSYNQISKLPFSFLKIKVGSNLILKNNNFDILLLSELLPEFFNVKGIIIYDDILY